jgi:hypothetical protein
VWTTPGPGVDLVPNRDGFAGLTAADWTAIATVALVLATAALVVVSARALRASARAADAAKISAESSERAAEHSALAAAEARRLADLAEATANVTFVVEPTRLSDEGFGLIVRAEGAAPYVHGMTLTNATMWESFEALKMSARIQDRIELDPLAGVPPFHLHAGQFATWRLPDEVDLKADVVRISGEIAYTFGEHGSLRTYRFGETVRGRPPG